MSVSSFPHAVSALGGGTLALSALSSTVSDPFAPYTGTCGVRVLTTGNVEEQLGGSWFAQNSATEWIDKFVGSDSASNYEVQLAGSGSGGTLSGPTLSTYHTISTTRQWTWSSTFEGEWTWSGTMTIREIADTSNSVSASVTLTVFNGAL